MLYEIIVILIVSHCGNFEQQGSLPPDSHIGEEIDIEEYPYIVAINGAKLPGCTGALISTEWILTSAHCINGTNGTKDILFATSDYELSNYSLKSYKYYVHPRFNETPENLLLTSYFMGPPVSFDIGLIKLESPAKFDQIENVSTIELQNPLEFKFERWEAKVCQQVGYRMNKNSTKLHVQDIVATYDRKVCNIYGNKFIYGNPTTLGCLGNPDGILICEGKATGILSGFVEQSNKKVCYYRDPNASPYAEGEYYDEINCDLGHILQAYAFIQDEMKFINDVMRENIILQSGIDNTADKISLNGILIFIIGINSF